jgi:predicted nucleic acid-binding protein
VAIVNQCDSQHEPCVQALQQIEAPLLTCWPVLTEAAWLLRNNRNNVRRLLNSVNGRFITLLDVRQDELSKIASRHQQYDDLAPQLADLTLVYLADREELHTVFTLDRRDFTIYQRSNGKSFQLLPESTA